MISVKEAVQSAVNYLREVSISDDPGLRVEEIEQTEDGQHWLVTLGFQGDELAIGPAYEVDTPLFGRLAVEAPPKVYPKYRREYRTFRVNASSGQVENMKIKNLNGDN